VTSADRDTSCLSFDPEHPDLGWTISEPLPFYSDISDEVAAEWAEWKEDAPILARIIEVTPAPILKATIWVLRRIPERWQPKIKRRWRDD
jgi:hypothetical protein